MASVINLLPQALANQIAAGEVVQRPASVAKELLENALDAGAERIDLILKDAGKALLQVVDNGQGMSPEDARMCFERHATSKISTADDLYAIRTFGFRGEAMASIASVAQVRLQTRQQGTELGTVVEIAGGQFERQAQAALPVGTSVAVSNLFYNVPARRKFLKSNPVETRHILNEFYRVALAWPGIRFTFTHNDTEVYDLPATEYQQRILDLHPQLRAEDLILVNEETPLLGIYGYMGRPEAARKTRGDQYFFLNGRYIRDGYLGHAILGAYEGLIERESFPFYCLYLRLDPAQVDVNIHPTKTEVKFEDERTLYTLLRSSAKAALGRLLALPQAPSQLPLDPGNNNPQQSFTGSFLGQGRPDGAAFRKPPVGAWQQLYGEFVQPAIQNPGPFPPATQQGAETVAERWEHLKSDTQGLLTEADGEAEPIQLLLTYVVVPEGDSLWVIDQHAAHQRILYEQALAGGLGGEHPSQQLLYPQTLQLPAAEMHLLAPALPELRRQGFDLRPVSNLTLLVSGLPAEIKHTEVAEVLETLVRELQNSPLETAAEGYVQERVALAVARQSAVRPGQRLSLTEMRALVRGLKACAAPAYAPDGSPTGFRLQGAEIRQRLGKSNAGA